MRLSVHHTTRYRFAQPVARGLQRLRMKPKTGRGQEVLEWRMELDGAKLEAEYNDQHNNWIALISATPGTSVIAITCSGLIETADEGGMLGLHRGAMPLWAFLEQTALTRPGPRLAALVAALDADRGDPLALLHALSRAVLAAVRYETGQTDAETTAEAALAAGRGVCQDHAHIFIGAARALGIPARYVSGYLMIDDRIEQDAGHGWAEAHVEGLGWTGFDVSNAISPDARYIRVATGSDYREAAPVTGITYGTGTSTLSVSLAVEQQPDQQ